MSQWFRRKRWNSIPGTELACRVGTSLDWTCTVVDTGGQPVDLTAGYTATLILKKRPGSLSAVLTCLSGSARLELDSLGGVTLHLSPADTTALGIGRLVYETRVTSPGGAVTLADFGTLCVSA